MNVVLAPVVAELQVVMAKALGEAVVELVDLVDTRLRAVGTEAQREGRLIGVGSGEGDRRNARCSLVFCGDGKSEAGRRNDMLRLDCVEVEAGVVDLKVVDRGGTDLADLTGEYWSMWWCCIAEARNGCTGKWKGFGLSR